jgi:hypothetical protein
MQFLIDLFGLFRRAPIRSHADLADFIDRQTAFLTQKGIYEYSRARAGHYAKVLFADAGFVAAIEDARWRAYPLGLAMVGELVTGLLRPHLDSDPRQLLALGELVLSVFDRYPVPPSIGTEGWQQARAELAHRLETAGLHAPKPAKDIPTPLAQNYFDLMPIHPSLRGRDFPTTRNYLRVTLCNIHDELTKRVDGPALGAELRQRLATAPV